FVFVSTTFNHRMCNTRIDDAHHIQCLYDYGTVMTAYANIRFEMIVAFKIFNAVNQFLIDFWRSTAHLNECQDEGCEFFTQRKTGKCNAGVFSWSIHTETWRSF